MEKSMLKLLDEYIANNTKETFKRHWDEVNAMGLVGPNVYEFIDMMDDIYIVPPDEET